MAIVLQRTILGEVWTLQETLESRDERWTLVTALLERHLNEQSLPYDLQVIAFYDTAQHVEQAVGMGQVKRVTKNWWQNEPHINALQIVFHVHHIFFTVENALLRLLDAVTDFFPCGGSMRRFGQATAFKWRLPVSFVNINSSWRPSTWVGMRDWKLLISMALSLDLFISSSYSWFHPTA